MNLIQRVINQVKLYLTPQINQLPAGKAEDEDQRLLHRLRRQYVYRIKAEMKAWRDAIASAENPLRPDRLSLYALYREIELDDQVTTQIRIAKATVTNAPFEITREGQANEDLDDLFARPWFLNYLRWSVDTEFWGHTLLEFEPEQQNGEFTNINLIPRDHVKPEYGTTTIYVNEQGERGIPFRNNKELKHLVEIGNPWDLGLFRIVAVPVIRKRYSDTDWSLFSEKFGMPFLVVKTASRQKNELDAKEEMARNFGANSYAIFDDQDELEAVNSNFTGTGHYIYRDRLQDSDDRIAKIINGQTGASDEKAWVGSAEVHERILNDFVKDRLTNIQYHINFKLIPKLIEHGYPLAGAKFEFVELRKENRESRPGAGEQDEEMSAEKKSLVVSLSDLYSGITFPEDVERLAFQQIPDGIGYNVALQVFQGSLQDGMMHPELFEAYSNTLLQSIADGADNDDLAGGLSYQDRDFDLLKRLRRSAWEFAAAKGMRMISELAANGATDLDAFNDFALPLINRYNRTWLETEYRLGVANTQQAIKWQDIQERKEALPMLRYVTAKDERVRDSHAQLHGATYPIDDPFWDKYYPPNGYNCRCTVQQVAGPQRDADGIPDDIPTALRDNPGKSGRLYAKTHPYFLEVADDRLRTVVDQLAAGLNVYDLIYEAEKAMVLAHPIRYEDDLAENELIARKLADDGIDVVLLPNTNERDVKSPDATVGDSNTTATFRAPGNSRSAIQSAIRRGVTQGVALVALHFPNGYDANTLRRALLAGRDHGYYDQVGVWIVAGAQVITLEKKDLQNGDINL